MFTYILTTFYAFCGCFVSVLWSGLNLPCLNRSQHHFQAEVPDICHTSTFEAAPSDCDVSSPLPSSLHLGSPHLFASHRYGSGSAICWPSMGSLGLSIREKNINKNHYWLIAISCYFTCHICYIRELLSVELSKCSASFDEKPLANGFWTLSSPNTIEDQPSWARTSRTPKTNLHECRPSFAKTFPFIVCVTLTYI